LATDNEMCVRRENMKKLHEELLAVEHDRVVGCVGITPDELDTYLERVIDEVVSREATPDKPR